MALFETYGDFNRVVDNGLLVTYSKQKIYGSWSHTVGAGMDTYYESWEYTRYAKKSYRYVGMSESGALVCANDLVINYERFVYDSVWDLNDDAEFAESATPSAVLMAEISVQHEAGCMWSVIVNINETDVRRRRVSVSQPASVLFYRENARIYNY